MAGERVPQLSTRVQQFLKMLNIKSPHDPAPPLRAIPKTIANRIHTKAGSQLFSEALLIAIKR